MEPDPLPPGAVGDVFGRNGVLADPGNLGSLAQATGTPLSHLEAGWQHRTDAIAKDAASVVA